MYVHYSTIMPHPAIQNFKIKREIINKCPLSSSTGVGLCVRSGGWKIALDSVAVGSPMPRTPMRTFLPPSPHRQKFRAKLVSIIPLYRWKTCNRNEYSMTSFAKRKVLLFDSWGTVKLEWKKGSFSTFFSGLLMIKMRLEAFWPHKWILAIREDMWGGPLQHGVTWKCRKEALKFHLDKQVTGALFMWDVSSFLIWVKTFCINICHKILLRILGCIWKKAYFCLFQDVASPVGSHHLLIWSRVWSEGKWSNHHAEANPLWIWSLPGWETAYNNPMYSKIPWVPQWDRHRGSVCRTPFGNRYCMPPNI